MVQRWIARLVWWLRHRSLSHYPYTPLGYCLANTDFTTRRKKGQDVYLCECEYCKDGFVILKSRYWYD